MVLEISLLDVELKSRLFVYKDEDYYFEDLLIK